MNCTFCYHNTGSLKVHSIPKEFHRVRGWVTCLSDYLCTLEILCRIRLEQRLGSKYASGLISNENQTLDSHSMALKFHKLFLHFPSSNVTTAWLVCDYHIIIVIALDHRQFMGQNCASGAFL